jgi:hypothetical protein
MARIRIPIDMPLKESTAANRRMTGLKEKIDDVVTTDLAFASSFRQVWLPRTRRGSRVGGCKKSVWPNWFQRSELAVTAQRRARRLEGIDQIEFPQLYGFCRTIGNVQPRRVREVLVARYTTVYPTG